MPGDCPSFGASSICYYSGSLVRMNLFLNIYFCLPGEVSDLLAIVFLVSIPKDPDLDSGLIPKILTCRNLFNRSSTRTLLIVRSDGPCVHVLSRFSKAQIWGHPPGL
jgi:hypothetical protein